jgi:hypothetical protein
MVSGQPLAPAHIPAAPQLPELKHFNLRLFEIPYDWTGGARPTGATAVKLYVSSDQGKTWQEISSARHDVQYFRFHAPADGEYWFAIRTIDSAGRARPEGPLAPEQRMLVDTQNPEITRLEAVRTSPSQIEVRWEAADAFIDPASLVAEYRTQASDWLPMKALGALHPAPGVVTGHAMCEIDPAITAAWVRVTVRDMAGNGRQAGAEVRAAGAPAGPLAGEFPSQLAPPLSTRQGPPPQVEWGAVGNAVQRPASQVWPSDGATSAPLLTGPAQASPAQSYPATSYPAAPQTPAVGGGGLAANVPPLPTQPGSPPASGLLTPPSLAQAPPTGLVRPGVPSHFASSQTAPGLGLAPASPPAATAGPVPLAAQPPAMSPAPPTPHVDQYLNKLQLDFDYNIQSLGGAGIARVELWVTTDDGSHWQRLAIDNDNRSPIQVQLPQAGRYGLRIVVQPVGGFEPITPRSGDKPEMTIVVDTQPPLARMTSVQQGTGYHADHLLVRWEAADAHLRNRGATLRYAARREGPWQTIADSLDPTGEYPWRLGRHVPTQFYLQLEVVDEAGNRTIDTTAVPVTITLPEASGQLQQARPVGQ